MIEVVTWLAQYEETQRVGVKLWFNLYFMQYRQKATKSFPALKLDVVVNKDRSCIPNRHVFWICHVTT